VVTLLIQMASRKRALHVQKENHTGKPVGAVITITGDIVEKQHKKEKRKNRKKLNPKRKHECRQ
jgi:hypothetical protein